MRSGDLLAYLSLNRLSYGTFDVPNAILFKFDPEFPFLRNSTCVRQTDGRMDGQT